MHRFASSQARRAWGRKRRKDKKSGGLEKKEGYLALPLDDIEADGLRKDQEIARDTIDLTQLTEFGADYWGKPEENHSRILDARWQPRRRRTEVGAGQPPAAAAPPDPDSLEAAAAASFEQTLARELGCRCRNLWAAALAAPACALATVTLTVLSSCRRQRHRCVGKDVYPTLSAAAEHGAGEWVFELGVLALSGFSLATLLGFLWVVAENTYPTNALWRELRFCFAAALFGCLSTVVLASANLRTHHLAHTAAAALYFPAACTCLLSARRLRRRLHKENKLVLEKTRYLRGVFSKARGWVLLGKYSTFLGCYFAALFALFYFQINIIKSARFVRFRSFEGIFEQLSIMCQCTALGSLWPELMILNRSNKPDLENDNSIHHGRDGGESVRSPTNQQGEEERKRRRRLDIGIPVLETQNELNMKLKAIKEELTRLKLRKMETLGIDRIKKSSSRRSKKKTVIHGTDEERQSDYDAEKQMYQDRSKSKRRGRANKNQLQSKHTRATSTKTYQAVRTSLLPSQFSSSSIDDKEDSFSKMSESSRHRSTSRKISSDNEENSSWDDIAEDQIFTLRRANQEGRLRRSVKII